MNKKMVLMTIAIGLIVFIILFDIFFSLSRLYVAKELTSSTNYSGNHTFYSESNRKMNILVDGDSIAAGVGSSRFNYSIAGRIGKHFSENRTVNVYVNAKSGSRVKDLINKTVPEGHYDLAVITISSNDLFRFSYLRTFRDPVNRMYKKYSNLADWVVVVGPGKVHATNGIPKLMKPIYHVLGPLYGRVLREEAQDYPNVIHINPHDSLHLPEYGKIEAKDMFHPNNEGHKYWFDMFMIGYNQTQLKR